MRHCVHIRWLSCPPGRQGCSAKLLLIQIPLNYHDKLNGRCVDDRCADDRCATLLCMQNVMG